jgi:hypothetical protein
MRKNRPGSESRFQYTHRAAVPPSGPSMPFSLDPPSLAATREAASEEMQDGMAELSDSASDTLSNNSQPDGELANSAADMPADNSQPDRVPADSVANMPADNSRPDGELADNAADIPSNDSRPNGDEVDSRMARIAEILGYAAMPLLEKCGLVAEWVHHAEAAFSGQVVQKPKGRPEGGLARAARELPVPGKTPEARRQFVKRAIAIDGMRPEAKSAAIAAGLDGTQSALLAIASERSPEAQVTKVKEIAARKAAKRQRKIRVHEGEARASGPDGAGTEFALSSGDEQQLAGLTRAWSESGVLERDSWTKASEPVRRRFADLLLKDSFVGAVV